MLNYINFILRLSYAQVDALVQRAPQSILDLEGIQQDDNEDLRSGDRPSLSSKPAAYGESPVSLRVLKRGRMGKIWSVVLMLGGVS